MSRKRIPTLSNNDADFIRIVHKLARYRSTRDIFADYCELAYCAIAKRTLPAGQKADALESRWAATMKAGDDYAQYMPQLLAHTTMAMNDLRDFLGPVAAALNVLNLKLGQFFTPPDLCEVMARMVLDDLDARIADKGYISLADPACGSGAMMLASAKVAREGGHDPAQIMYIEATDIDPVCFKMAYIQFALGGLNARVVCGNGPTGEESESALTPAAVFHSSRRAAQLAAPRGKDSAPAIAMIAEIPARPRLTKFARGEQADAPPRLSAPRQRVARLNSLAGGVATTPLLMQGRNSNREDTRR